jgi:hypothetical protein
MTDAFDLLIRGGVCATPNGIAPADVGVKDGKIVAVGALGTAMAAEVFEAKGLHVLPGVIDTQVHFREPGNEHKEDLESGSRAAVLGGVTAVFEMPNTAPPTTTRAAIEDKLARARNRMHCDYAFYVGATPANVGALAVLERLPGVAGVKAFLGSSTGTLLLDHERANIWRSKATCGLTPYGGTPKRRAPLPNACCVWRARQGGDYTSFTSRPPMNFRCWPPHEISPLSKPRRSTSRWPRRIATSGWAPMRK